MGESRAYHIAAYLILLVKKTERFDYLKLLRNLHQRMHRKASVFAHPSMRCPERDELKVVPPPQWQRIVAAAFSSYL